MLSGDRRAAFCLQEHRALELIHGRWKGRERATAIAIYQAMTYVASLKHRDGGRSGFPATRAEIAEKAGSKPATVDAYAQQFIELGLLAIEPRQSESGHDLPNSWVLDTPSSDGGSSSVPPVAVGGPVQHPRGSSSGAEQHPLTRAQQDVVEERKEEPPQPPKGGRARDHQRFRQECVDFGAVHFPDLGASAGVAVAQAVEGADARTLGDVSEFVERWWRKRSA